MTTEVSRFFNGLRRDKLKNDKSCAWRMLNNSNEVGIFCRSQPLEIIECFLTNFLSEIHIFIYKPVS